MSETSHGEKMNCWEETRVHVCVYVSCVFSQSERTYSSLTPQVETVIIEVSTVQALRGRRVMGRTSHGLETSHGEKR